MSQATDLTPDYQPTISSGPRGYMAHGIGWAVGPYPTLEAAIAAFRERQALLREIDARIVQQRVPPKK